MKQLSKKELQTIKGGQTPPPADPEIPKQSDASTGSRLERGVIGGAVGGADTIAG